MPTLDELDAAIRAALQADARVSHARQPHSDFEWSAPGR